MSAETLNLYQKLHKIQQSVMGLGKDKNANSYAYVTGDKVLNTIKPLMNSLGLLLKQEIIALGNIRQDYTVGGSNPRPKSEILSKVTMRFTWVDIESGEKDENLFAANGQNDWDKGVGSALTYGERYFLLKFFHIATDADDLDALDRPEASPVNSLINQDVKDAIKEAKTIQDLLRLHDSVTDLHDNAEYKTLMGARKTEIKKKGATA